MSICPSDAYDKALTKMLKMSLVPVPCQESQLSSKGCVRSENIEWLLDLKDKLPIWSRLNEINTSGYNRKLPMSMTKCYDIEITGRLWSLWGTLKTKKPPVCSKKSINEPYLATTVISLCAAQVFRLNIWSPQLMDSIAVSGERYLKESLRNFNASKKGFQLEDLACDCSLEGINFKVFLKTKQVGCLYSAPFRGRMNLAFALINFLARHQFGIVECFRRFVGFGFIPGTDGGYFMFDAQSMNYPLFRKDQSAAYMLRTNHLQILLYCLIVALNVPYTQANFTIHNVDIEVLNKPHICPCKPSKLPEECWTPASVTIPYEVRMPLAPKKSAKVLAVKHPDKISAKYQRALHPLPKLEVENCLVQPMVDAKEDYKEDHDFVKMICSETMIPLTAEEKLARIEFSFVTTLPHALIWR